jgi:hypothetical protein
VSTTLVAKCVMSPFPQVVEMSFSLTQHIICSFSIRINNRTCYLNLCPKDDYDYGDPRNDPIFVIEHSSPIYCCYEVNFSSNEVIWVGNDWYFYGSESSVWKELRVREKRRLIRKCKRVLRKTPSWRWIVGIDYE